jgi:hypothetical protein
MSLRSEIASLARQFSEEDNAAFDLWSWLPSHKAAEKFHGDRAFNFRPSNADVMREAALVFSLAKYTTDDDRASWWKRNKEEADSFFKCPCDEPHEVPHNDDMGEDPGGAP